MKTARKTEKTQVTRGPLPGLACIQLLLQSSATTVCEHSRSTGRR